MNNAQAIQTRKDIVAAIGSHGFGGGRDIEAENIDRARLDAFDVAHPDLGPTTTRRNAICRYCSGPVADGGTDCGECR
jgi:hypothetical protein